MTYVQGQSGNPKGNNGHSTRRKETREALDAIKNAGYIDPLIGLAKTANTTQNEAVSVSANTTLALYIHNKLQPAPAPTYNDHPFDIPPYKTIEDAKNFLATIPGRISRKKLSLEVADSLTKSTVAWVQLQYAERGIDLKAQAQGASDGDQTIRVTGGLPALPGTNISMPNLSNGHEFKLLEPSQLNPSSMDGVHTADLATPPSPLAAAEDSIPRINSIPPEGSS